MTHPENLPPALHAQNLFEQSTRSLQGLYRLPTALQAMTDVARQHQERLQACASGGDTFREARQAAARLAEPYAEMRRLAQTLGDTFALPTALQEMEEAHRRTQELQEACARIVGDQSTWGQARQALEDCDRQSRALGERAAQCARAFQAQMEQATASARGWQDDNHTRRLFDTLGSSHGPLMPITNLPESLASSFLARIDDTPRMWEQEVWRHGVEAIEAVRQADAHLQAELREIITVLRELGHRGIPQDSLSRPTLEAGPPSVAVPRNKGGREKFSEASYLKFLAEITTRIKNYRIDHPGQNPLLKEIWSNLPTEFSGRTHRTYTRWLKEALKLQGSPAPNIQAWMKTLPR